MPARPVRELKFHLKERLVREKRIVESGILMVSQFSLVVETIDIERRTDAKGVST